MIRVVLHPLLASDLSEIMGHYEQTANAELADEFYRELRRRINEAARNPDSFSVREHDVRRANLRRFPYHFLFRVIDNTVRILVVRHHRRHPSLGTKRR